MMSHTDGQGVDHTPLTNGRVGLVFSDGDELVVIGCKTDKDVIEETLSSTHSTTTAVRARCTRAGVRQQPG